MVEQIVRGPLLIPRDGGVVEVHVDGVLLGDERGRILYAGEWSGVRCQLGHDVPPVRHSDGVMLPPLLDIHTHVPQHPIRGRFAKGVGDDEPGGKLLNSLRRNVFPAEARCAIAEHATRVTRAFLDDTLSHGVVGGACYMTPSAVATEVALSILPEAWSVGLVMMNQNCPPDLCSDEATFDADVERLARKFGKRLIVTDRFAVAVSAPFRRRGSTLAKQFGLRTQTHLNEQVAEKTFVEHTLYPDAASYTDVYRRGGLLDHQCIAAHCIQMQPEEWALLRDTGSTVAHCPTSNILLGSGVMPLDEVLSRAIPYALGTDIGASPTVSMLAEMGRFLQVHAGRSTSATPAEALYRSTLAPSTILGIDHTLGQLQLGRPLSFIEATPATKALAGAKADGIIQSLVPADLDAPSPAVNRVVLSGKIAFERRPWQA